MLADAPAAASKSMTMGEWMALREFPGPKYESLVPCSQLVVTLIIQSLCELPSPAKKAFLWEPRSHIWFWVLHAAVNRGSITWRTSPVVCLCSYVVQACRLLENSFPNFAQGWACWAETSWALPLSISTQVPMRGAHWSWCHIPWNDSMRTWWQYSSYPVDWVQVTALGWMYNSSGSLLQSNWLIGCYCLYWWASARSSCWLLFPAKLPQSPMGYAVCYS